MEDKDCCLILQIRNLGQSALAEERDAESYYLVIIHKVVAVFSLS